jgi:hypothetical protein
VLNDSLKDSSALVALDIGRNQLTDRVTELLVLNWSAERGPVEVRLGSNKIGDMGGVRLGERNIGDSAEASPQFRLF